MSENRSIQLVSFLAKIGNYLLALLFIPFTVLIEAQLNNKYGYVLALFVFFLSLFFLSKGVISAKLQSGMITYKKMIGPIQNQLLSEIKNIKTFRSRYSKYNWVSFNDGSSIMIAESRFSNKDSVQEILMREMRASDQVSRVI